MVSIALDIGNSSVKVGVFSGAQLSYAITLPHGGVGLTEVVEQYGPTVAVVGDVRGSGQQEVQALVRMGVQVVPVSCELRWPFRTQYRTLATLGADRVGALAGVQQLYPGQTCMVVDLGTAITYDLLLGEGLHAGGAISPGVRMRFAALHAGTGHLPQLVAAPLQEAIGLDTSGSIRHGVLDGVRYELEGFAGNFSNFAPLDRVVLTGGDAQLLRRLVRCACEERPHLVLEGYNYLLRYNAR